MNQESHSDSVEALLTAADPGRLVAAAHALHPADVAAAMAQMDRDRQFLVFACLDDASAAAVLGELDLDLQQSLLAVLPLARTSDIVEEMPADDAADLLGDLPQGHADAILGAMESEDAADVRALLDYDSDTAGGAMTTEFVAVSESLTVEETIQRLRELAPEAETVYYLYVVDERDRLVGVVSLRSLIVSDPGAKVADVMCREVISLPADADQEDAAELIARYNLVAAPVIDSEGRPIGIITVDDAIDVIDEEAAEDIYELGGGAEEGRDTPTSLGLLRRRLPRFVWTLGAAILVGVVLRALLAALGGDSGSAAGARGYATLPWLVAAFLPAMLTLSWLLESHSRASLIGRLAAARERYETIWAGLWSEIGASALLALGCAAACAAAAYTAGPRGSLVVILGGSIAVGLLASSLAAYLFPRLVLAGRAQRDTPPAGATIAAHAVGALAYLGAAYWTSRW